MYCIGLSLLTDLDLLHDSFVSLGREELDGWACRFKHGDIAGLACRFKQRVITGSAYRF